MANVWMRTTKTTTYIFSDVVYLYSGDKAIARATYLRKEDPDDKQSKSNNDLKSANLVLML